jgi:4-hydroxy-2-oxoglutarate aldolase
MAKRFEGIFPALTTPFDGEVISIDRFRENIEKFNAFGLAGYVVLGSTGECVSVSGNEAERLVRTAMAAVGPDKVIIAGTGQESTRLTLELTNRLAGEGIVGALVRPPGYYRSKMTREALRRHFLTVADGTKTPLILYNIPQNTGVVIEPSLVIELAGHPNIVGLKDSSGSMPYFNEIVRQIPEDFSCLLGSGYLILPGLVMGATGAILAVANAAPGPCVEIFRLFKEGKVDDAAARQLDLVPLNKAVMETYGIAGLKSALDAQGFYGGPVRLPLLGIEEAGKAEIREHLKALKLID